MEQKPQLHRGMLVNYEGQKYLRVDAHPIPCLCERCARAGKPRPFRIVMETGDGLWAIEDLESPGVLWPNVLELKLTPIPS